MASHNLTFNPVLGTFQFSYSPGNNYPDEGGEGLFSNGKDVPEGSWTAFVSPFQLSHNAGIGLTMLLESGDALEFLAHMSHEDAEDVVFVLFEDRLTLRVEQFEDGTLVYSHTKDFNLWTEVARFTPESPVREVGVVLRYDDPGSDASGQASQVALVKGIWQHDLEEVWLGEPPALLAQRSRAGIEVPTVTSTAEPPVHCIVGAQFGDLEFDVGKSVRWMTWFVDNLFILDINLGTPRYWIVNWAQTFPYAKHEVTGINYFVLPTEFRKEQWRQYKRAFGTPADDEWIIFVDAHEGFSVDNRSLPNDYTFAPFKSFLWREIQRAIDAGQPYAILPFYVFLRSANVTNVTYAQAITDPDGQAQPVEQSLSVPYYQPHQGQKRLWKASELKKTDFDWSQIDTPVTASAGAKAQIISYGYAHWNLQDIEPPATTVPPLSAANDDGWRMRNLLSQVRPIPGLPIGAWVASGDPAGLPGPWAPDDVNNPDALDPVTGAPLAPPVAANAALAGIVTPLYDCAFRLNMRDGVWYEEGMSGNIPLRWDSTNQRWTTDYDPATWADQGVESYDPAAVP